MSLLFTGCQLFSNPSLAIPTNTAASTTTITQTQTPLVEQVSPTRVVIAFASATTAETKAEATIPVVATLPPSDQPATPTPIAWQNMPVIPVVGPRVIEIYRQGLMLGNNPHAFSKIGDCGTTPAWFLGDFDHDPQFYNLGEYTSLQPVIQEFRGSFSRTSLAARSGFNASSVFSPLWSDPKQCQPQEAPLGCEYRVNRPILALITLGTNDIWHPDVFEEQMRKIIEFSINRGVIPVLATKADNIEGDGSINATISKLAVEYGIPLWNYWLAVQPLPEHGLQEDGAHLTWGPNRFDDPQNMNNAWPIRNLTALQVLDALWRAVK